MSIWPSHAHTHSKSTCNSSHPGFDWNWKCLLLCTSMSKLFLANPVEFNPRRYFFSFDGSLSYQFIDPCLFSRSVHVVRLQLYCLALVNWCLCSPGLNANSIDISENNCIVLPPRFHCWFQSKLLLLRPPQECLWIPWLIPFAHHRRASMYVNCLRQRLVFPCSLPDPQMPFLSNLQR